MKLKKRLAALLTVAMVMTMTVPAMATEGVEKTVPDKVDFNGTGTSEGHVDRELGKVLLPTVSDNAFNYTVDPERLVAATDGAKYAPKTFSTNAKANGVYFLLSDNTYDDRTEEYEFKNMSSYPINLSVEVKAAERTAKDLPLVSADGLNTAAEASLYLGLKVGSETFPVLYGQSAKKTVSIDGVFDNFSVSWNGTDYEFKKKADADEDAWQTETIQILGKATDGSTDSKYQIAQDTSTPALSVTWSWKKYSTERVSKKVLTAADNSLDVETPDGVTYAVALQHADGTGGLPLTEGDQYTVSGTTLTIAGSDITTWLGLSPAYSRLEFTYSDGKKDIVTLE